MTHSWKKCWTDGQTGDWWQRFYRTLCRMESNNVKGIQTLQKRIKLFEYSKSSVTPNGLIFLKDTHSWMSNEKKWEDKFNGKLFFSHIKTNSCGVLICYCGTKKFEIIIKKTMWQIWTNFLIWFKYWWQPFCADKHNANDETDQL